MPCLQRSVNFTTKRSKKAGAAVERLRTRGPHRHLLLFYMLVYAPKMDALISLKCHTNIDGGCGNGGKITLLVEFRWRSPWVNFSLAVEAGIMGHLNAVNGIWIYLYFYLFSLTSLLFDNFSF